ncbi:MAG: methyltransferase domain-containing protein [Candidatus Micrarchaeia archaeon]|jgi:ubiquinone/menaquinone biosynthesis C-methylase UbiE
MVNSKKIAKGKGGKKAPRKEKAAKTKPEKKPKPAAGQNRKPAAKHAAKKPAIVLPKIPAKAPSVEKSFDEIAEDWDSKRQEPSSPMPVFLGTLKRFLRGNYYGVRVLDIGCGNARNAAYLVRELRFATVACADVSQNMLLQAQKTAIKYNLPHSIQFSRANAASLSFPSLSFSAAFSMAVFHHLATAQERQKAFTELYRVLRVPAIAFVTVWNSDQPKLAKYGGKKDALVSWKTPGGKTTERYYHFFNEKELKALAEGAGFKVLELFFEKDGKKSAKKGAANICMVLLKSA